MNIELIGGPLYQWDTGRKIKINCPEAVEAHFEDREADKSPVLEIREEKGERVADIPNYMLQRHGQLVVYLVKVSDTSVQTKHSYPLFIHARQRPSEYVYTETEVLDYRKIAQEALERLDETEGFALAAQESARVAQEAQTATEEARADAEKLVNEAETAKDETLETLNATKEATQVVLNAAELAQQSEARAGERANEADQSAQNAASSEQAAKTAEQEAKAAQAETETAKQSAEKSATEAKEARAGAERLALDAQTAQKAAESAKDGAESAEQIAKDKANEAGQSASRAEASEQAAKQSETNAANAASEAAQSAAEAKQSAEDAKGVRTVNGVSPDENGNVEIVAGEQSDWNESDPESLAYVKNRTHYESVEPRYSGTVNTLSVEGLYVLSISMSNFTEPLVVGDDLRIVFNGTEYNYTVLDGTAYDSVGVFGNLETFVPFAAQVNDEYCLFMVPSAGEYTLEIYKVTLQKLDNKFLDLDWLPKLGESTTFIPETSWDNSALDGDQESFYGGASIGLVVGVTYTVIWNGTEYVCTAIEIIDGGMTGVALGNVGLAMGSGDTGEPFVLIDGVDMGDGQLYCMGIALDGSVSGTYSIMVGGGINKLPNEFLDLDWIPKKEVVAGETILPKTTYTLDEGSVMNQSLIGLVVGETYLVTWDGAEYICTAENVTVQGVPAVGIGNGVMFGEEDTGIPFGAGDAASYGISIIASVAGDSDSHTISIHKFTEKVPKLPNEYIDAEWMATKTKGYTEIIPETTHEFSSDGDNTNADLGYALTIEGGNKYLVVFDGVEYELTGVLGEVVDIPCIIVGSQDYSSTPFWIMLANADTTGLGVWNIFVQTAGSHTFALKTEGGYEYNKLPNKYLDLTWIPKLGQEQFEGEILPEQTVDNNVVGGGNTFTSKATGYDKIKIGDTVIVTWDGTPYECEVKDSGTFSALGSSGRIIYAGNFGGMYKAVGLDFGIPDTEEPFLVSFWRSVDGESGAECGVSCATEAGEGEHTVSIVAKRKGEPLPEALLPESVESVVIRSSTEGSTKKFRITVDDSGTITATEV